MGDAIAEKRVFTRAGETADVFVAAEIGVVAVAVSGDRVGEFGIAHRCTPADIAAAPGRLSVATDEDVLVSEGEAFDGTGFGAAVAVDVDEAIVSAAPDGRVARYTGEGWTTVTRVDAEVRAIAGPLVATDEGVYRIAEATGHAGLTDVHDIAVDGLPLAATADGLYRLGNGWMRVVSGEFRAVATDGDRAHAASTEGAYARENGNWRELDLPSADPPIGFAYDDAVYAVTADGTFLADAGAGFRAHPLGVSDVVGLACPA